MSTTFDDNLCVFMDFSQDLSARQGRNTIQKQHYDPLTAKTSRYQVIYNGAETRLDAFINGDLNAWINPLHCMGCQTDLVLPLREILKRAHTDADIDKYCDSYCRERSILTA